MGTGKGRGDYIIHSGVGGANEVKDPSIDCDHELKPVFD
jgi:hypothetical protein